MQHTVNSATFHFHFLVAKIILQTFDNPPRTLVSICRLFSPRKGPGYNISMRMIKHSFHLISASLASIINLSFSKGIFPNKLKIG